MRVNKLKMKVMVCDKDESAQISVGNGILEEVILCLLVGEEVQSLETGGIKLK